MQDIKSLLQYMLDNISLYEAAEVDHNSIVANGIRAGASTSEIGAMVAQNKKVMQGAMDCLVQNHKTMAQALRLAVNAHNFTFNPQLFQRETGRRKTTEMDKEGMMQIAKETGTYGVTMIIERPTELPKAV